MSQETVSYAGMTYLMLPAPYLRGDGSALCDGCVFKEETHCPNTMHPDYATAEDGEIVCKDSILIHDTPEDKARYMALRMGIQEEDE